MKENSYRYKDMIENLPFGFAYNKAIYNEDNNPVDYIILAVNKKFQEIIGLKKENIIGKKISNIVDNVEKSSFARVQFFGQIALSGESKKFEQYFKSLDKWFDVKVYSEKKEYFTTIFSDATERKSKEEELNLSKFSLDEAPMEIFWINPQGKINYVNNTAAEKLNYKKDELIEAKVSDIDPTFSQENRNNIWKKLRRNEFQKFESKHMTKNGNKYPVEITSRYIKYKGKEYEFAFAQDIEARKRSENTLKYSRERYETIFNSSPIGIIIEDENGKIVEVNDKVSEMTGYSEDELEGSNVLEKLVLSEYKKEAKQNIKNIVEGEDLEFDIKTPTKEGKIKISHLRETNITLPNGNKGIISMYLDITERKKLEKDLREKNILLNSILKSIQDGISVLNPDLTIRYTNETMKRWYSNDLPLKGKKCFKAYHDKKSECDTCPVLKSLKTGEVESEIVPGKENSDIDFIELFSYPIYDDNKDKITGVVELVRDISARLKQRKQLEMLNFSINKADLLILRITPEGVIDYVNETALGKLGYKEEELIGFEAKKIIQKDDYIERDVYWNNLKSSKSIKYETRFKPNNKKAFPVEVTSQYFKYGQEEYEFSFVQDITARKEKEREIRYLLYRDTLTGLYNRRFFEEEMKRLDTKRQLPISIIMADVNGLKIINDSYGHKKGDELLVKTAKILKSSLRKEDVLVRHGGDEFAILLPQTASKEAQKVIDRIKEKTNSTKENPIPISIGTGMATKRREEKSIEDTLKKADNVMYKNKLSKSKSTKNKIIQNLLTTLQTKSSETKEHAVRMGKLANELGEKINLSNSELNRLSLLVTLHDIGKTTISKKILNKPGDLTEEEWEIIKEHPETGYKIASASDEFALVAEEILCHHENWDGSGYPRGFKEENIPHLARIISIIDAYDVMTNDRPYSKAISKKKALEEIKDCAGSQFDPELAQEFIELKL